MPAHWLLAGSVLLASLGLSANWLKARRRRAGWLLDVAAQLVAVPYDGLTGQWGFIVVCALNLAIDARALLTWRRPPEKTCR